MRFSVIDYEGVKKLMNIYLRPKNIVVVGGGTGIGYATAQKLLDEGANSVVLASRNTQKLESAIASLKRSASQKVVSVKFDIANVQSHVKMLQEAQSVIGGGVEYLLDGCVISSGVNFDGSNWKGFNISEVDWDRVMNINLKGVFFLIRNFANLMYENHRQGNICVVSSISAHRDLLSIYQITKNALSRIVHAYGKHLCERGVVLNCVEPGTTKTDMMRNLADYTDGVCGGKPWNDASIKRLLRAEEIAEIIFFLMSNLGEAMSGSCVLASGGNKGLFP